MIRGNRELIGQALANLIDNALKYGVPEEPLEQRLRHVALEARRNGELAELIVADRGAGIMPGDRERVVDRFVRLENSRTRPGSGLGLSMAAAVAHLHGGALRLEDNAPGLRVVIALPLSHSPARPATRPFSATSAARIANGVMTAEQESVGQLNEPTTLAGRLNPIPRVHDMDGARARFDEFIARIAPCDAFALDLIRSEKVRQLLLGLADHSPFLWRLATGDTSRLVRLLQSAPDARLSCLLAETVDTCEATSEQDVVMRRLRQAREEVALLVALADLGGIWMLEDVTRALSRAADTFVRLRIAVPVARRRRAWAAFLSFRASRTGLRACRSRARQARRLRA